jgi:hypothetical protein
VRPDILIIGAIVAAVLGLVITRGRRRHAPPLLGTLTDRIDVSVTWNGDNLDIAVVPSCAEIRRGGSVRWYHNVEMLEVVPKPPSPGNAPWPFINQNPPPAGPDQEVESGPMKPDPVVNKASGYTLIMRVQRPNGPGNQIIKLDPDIIIREDKLRESFT